MNSTIVQEVFHAYRHTTRSPALAAWSISILGLGLGSIVFVWTIAYDVFVRPLAHPDPSRLVAIYERDVGGSNAFNKVAPANFLDWQDTAQSIEKLGAYAPVSLNLQSPQAGGVATRIDGVACSGDLFSTIGFRSILGRGLLPGDDDPGAPPVIVLSNDFWRRSFGGSTEVVGRRVVLDSTPFVVVGVSAVDPRLGELAGDVWIPTGAFFSKREMMSRGNHFLSVIGRLRPSVTLEEARVEFNRLTEQIGARYPGAFMGDGATVVTLRRGMLRSSRSVLILLAAAAACFLLLVSFNVGSLLLARLVSRTSELATRLSLGATSSMLFRQLFIESLLVVLGAATLAIVLSDVAVRLDGVATALPPVQYGWRTTLVNAGLASIASLAIAALLALIQFVFVIRIQTADALAGTRFSTGGSGGAKWSFVLATVELGFSLVLVINLGLVTRSYVSALESDTQVRNQGLIVGGLSLPSAGYSDGERSAEFVHSLIRQLTAERLVSSVTATTQVPLDGLGMDQTFKIVGAEPLPPGKYLDARYRQVAPNYFGVLGLSILDGQSLTAVDRDENVVVVNEIAARKFWPNRSPVGEAIYMSDRGPRFRVIGVSQSVPPKVGGTALPTIYIPFSSNRRVSSNVYLILDGAGDTEAISRTIERVVGAIDPSVAVFDVRLFSEIVQSQLSWMQQGVLYVGALSVTGVLLACMGIVGLVSLSMSRRLREFALRMALGASKMTILSTALRGAGKFVLIGLSLGLVLNGAFRLVVGDELDILVDLDIWGLLFPLAILGTVALGAVAIPVVRRLSSIDLSARLNSR